MDNWAGAFFSLFIGESGFGKFQHEVNYLYRIKTISTWSRQSLPDPVNLPWFRTISILIRTILSGSRQSQSWSGNLNTNPDNIIPETDNLNSHPNNLNPDPDNLNAEPNNLNPGPENLNPGPENLNPDPDNLDPDPNNLNPDPENLNPDSENFNQNPENLNPDPDNLNPEPNNLNPAPDNLNPDSENFNQNPENPNQDPENLNPDPENLNPDPQLWSLFSPLLWYWLGLINCTSNSTLTTVYTWLEIYANPLIAGSCSLHTSDATSNLRTHTIYIHGCAEGAGG